ncbi:hypothetical protein RI367_003450 [Sorochytrium milnesiophthora]
MGRLRLEMQQEMTPWMLVVRLDFKSCNKSEQYRNFMSASAESSQASSSTGNANAKFKRVQFQEAELQKYQPSSLKYYFVPFSDYADPEEQ